ncbi:MAG: OB-fold domain-containing protein [Haloarculaceae archaeon]
MIPERSVKPEWYTEFIDAVEQGTAEYLRCESCGAAELPPRSTCPECGSATLVGRELPDTGAVVTFTEIRTSIRKFEEETPYTVVMVELAESLRLGGQLRDADDVAIGDRLQVGAERREERADIVVFEPA